MKLPNWFKIIWWILLSSVVSFFLYKRYPQLAAGTATLPDIFIFLIWVALLLLPLFEELSFFGVSFKKAVEELKSDFSVKIENLKTDIKNTINFQVLMPVTGSISPGTLEEDKKKLSTKTAMEYKILNTLFTKQINKFPDLSCFFTFTILANAFEYNQFRIAGAKLIGEGLVGETETGQYHLTYEGWEWCKKHYREFPEDQWLSHEPINEENLKKVLK